jgi:IgGFc binding protein
MNAMRVLALATTLLACSGEDGRGQVALPVIDECDQMSDRVLCSGGAALRCVDGKVRERTACSDMGLTCAAGVGCRVCAPRTTTCDGNKRLRCSDDGSTLSLAEECTGKLSCSRTGCLDLCAEAAANRSYLGCDYWPVFTSNSQLYPEFFPALSIGNGNLVSAHIVITRGGHAVSELDVPAESASTVDLTFDAQLKDPRGSRLVRDGAYHLVSSVPVTVHQFNPLQYELPTDCAQEQDAQRGNGKCNSYTNDASLLLPSTALAPDSANGTSSVEFYAFSRSSFEAYSYEQKQWTGLPGFVAISAVGGAPVHVRIESSAITEPSPLGASELLPALRRGDVLERDLAPGDVLQLRSATIECGLSEVSEGRPFCAVGAEYDLTGTKISANGAIQVISGHDCSNVPFDRPACDHLEESMTPVATWGTSAVLTVPSASAGAQSYVRVISGADGNQVTFDPPLHEPVTLARGAMLEFNAREAVLVQGTGRLSVAQYLVGEGLERVVGDPSLSLAVPVDQYRQSYTFVSPATYVLNVVDIIATNNDVITLDGNVVTDFSQVGGSRFRVVSVPLDRAGSHEIQGTSAAGFGIVLYGLGSFTSYMLPGGLDLAPLVIGI